MKSIFDSNTRSEITQRINSLSEKHSAQWGKMNVYQMLKHCTLSDDMMNGKLVIPRVFIGRIIGPMILRKEMKDEKPFGKNSPTSKKVKTDHLAEGDLEEAKREWISGLSRYADFKNTSFVHPFFGPMPVDLIGKFVYKHADHHLRQFGA